MEIQINYVYEDQVTCITCDQSYWNTTISI